MSMEHKIPERTALEQNLLDAGCSREKTQQILRLWEENRMTELLQLLRCQRCRLMEARPAADEVYEMPRSGTVQEFSKTQRSGSICCINNLVI